MKANVKDSLSNSANVSKRSELWQKKKKVEDVKKKIIQPDWKSCSESKLLTERDGRNN